MNIVDVLNSKKEHIARFANANGAAGETAIIKSSSDLIARPKGKALANLLSVLYETGIEIRGSSFDAIFIPNGRDINLLDIKAIRSVINEIVFVEIKTANQARVKEDFSGFFFALTEKEIQASEALKDRHRVLLYNKETGQMLLTSIPDILARTKSMNWQLSVQL